MARAEAYLHAKFHLDPSNRLATIHRRYRQTDRTDRQDRQRTDSIGRTVLQTVAQKLQAGLFLDGESGISEKIERIIGIGAKRGERRSIYGGWGKSRRKTAIWERSPQSWTVLLIW